MSDLTNFDSIKVADEVASLENEAQARGASLMTAR
jgi:hypothetical protein